jgi:hypothetical protein
MKTTGFLAMLALVLVTSSAKGQENADSVSLQARCDSAAQVLRTGNPPSRSEWATAFIHSCGADAIANANVAALNRLRLTPDSGELEQVWNQLQDFRDARVYRVAVEIARDPQATETARIDALLWLLRLRAPSNFATKSDVTGGFDSGGNVVGGCGRFSHLAGPSPYIDGQPLPAGFAAEITALGGSISSDASQPLNVRTAARCAQTLGYKRP